MSALERFSKQNLELFRQKADPLADKVIEAYFPLKRQLLSDQLEAIQTNADSLANEVDPALKALHQDIQTKASAMPVDDLRKGQAFFNQHASDVMLLLGLLSLPYCYAAANGAEVLIRSRRILEEPEKRLLETAEFVFDVLNRNAFEPKGKGLVAVLKVRLMHAAARWYVKKDESWNEGDLGQPVNQEDMAGTNLAFSLIVTRGLKRLGKSISNEEALSYILYWNEIGGLLGVEEQLLPTTNKGAYVLERNIRERQFMKSESGSRLTKSLLNYFEKATLDSPLQGQSTSFVAYLLGEKVSEILGVENTRFDAAIFQPYKFFYKIQNVLTLKNDSYSRALVQFRLARQGSENQNPDA